MVGGASGDMLLSAFFELGFKKSHLEKLIRNLGFKGIKVAFKKIKVGHTKATKTIFSSKKDINLSFSKIKSLLSKAKISREVKTKSLHTYTLLKSVEEKIHNHKLYDFKFQHLGEIDAIVEITSFWQAQEELGIKQCFSSFFPLAKTSPATAELLKNKNVRFLNWDYETVTPTAAALLRDFPQEDLELTPKKIGYGAGRFTKPGYPDYTRIVLGQQLEAKRDIIKLEVNLDDINPQIFDYLMDLLFSAGAQDVYITPIVMKKSRPAFVLSVLLERENLAQIRKIIFSQTTTFGLRYTFFKKDKLQYNFEYKKTSLGKIKFRCGYLERKLIKESPEYSDCKKIASKYNIPLVEVYKKIHKTSLAA